MEFRDHPFTDLLLLIHVLYMQIWLNLILESILTPIFDSNEIYALINCIGVFDTIDSLDVSSSRITDSFNINALSATLASSLALRSFRRGVGDYKYIIWRAV